jgi:hypothetical protein
MPSPEEFANVLSKLPASESTKHKVGYFTIAIFFSLVGVIKFPYGNIVSVRAIFPNDGQAKLRILSDTTEFIQRETDNNCSAHCIYNETISPNNQTKETAQQFLPPISEQPEPAK